jgi:hypothetical protein
MAASKVVTSVQQVQNEQLGHRRQTAAKRDV